MSQEELQLLRQFLSEWPGVRSQLTEVHDYMVADKAANDIKAKGFKAAVSVIGVVQILTIMWQALVQSFQHNPPK